MQKLGTLFTHMHAHTCFTPLQDIQEAIFRSGVQQRLDLPADAAAAVATAAVAAAAAAPKRLGDMRRSTSPRSTITLKACSEADQALGTPNAVMGPGALQMRSSNRSEGDTEVAAAQQPSLCA
jgi:hypothetical protein